MPFDESAITKINEDMARGDFDSIWYRYQRIWQKRGFSGPDDPHLRAYLCERFGAPYPTTETPVTSANFLETVLFPSVAFIVEPSTSPAMVVRLTQFAAWFKDFGLRADVCPSSKKEFKEYTYYIVDESIDVYTNENLRPIADHVRQCNGTTEQKLPTRKESIQLLFDISGVVPPKVTIAIPTKNRAWCLPRAIKSLLDNDYPNLEISIADCNSTDNTREVMAQFEGTPEVKFHSGPYKNGAEALNAAINRSTGDYIGYLADDDYYDKNQIMRTAFYLASNPETFAVFADGQAYNTISRIKTYEVYAKLFLDFNTLLEKNFICGQTVMHKNNKEVMMGAIDPTGYGEDYLQWLYIAAKYGWTHLPFFSGTYTTGHPNRLGEVMIPRLAESNTFNQRYALLNYAPMRRQNKNDVHVAIFSEIYGRKGMGGPGAQHWNIVDALTQAGVDVAVVASKPELIELKNTDCAHRVISTKDFFASHIKQYNVIINFGADVTETLRGRGIRAICGSTIVTNCGFPEMIPYGGRFKSETEWNAAREGDEQTLNRLSAAFWIAQSAFQERSYRELCHYDGRVMRLNNPIDTENKFVFVPMEDRPKTVIWTGHGGRGKGFPEFLVLAKAMNDVKFIVLSASRIEKAPSLSNVRYVFGRYTEDMPAVLSEGCVLLTTSLCENQPVAVLEAMATGLPTVAFSSNSGMEEIVHDGENGRLVPFLDTPAMETALRTLLDDDGLRAEMGRNARSMVERDFSYDNCVSQFLNICGEYLDDAAVQKLKKQGVKL